MEYYSGDMVRGTRVRLQDPPRCNTESEINSVQDDTFELGFNNPDMILLTTNDETSTSASRLAGISPIKFAGRGSLSVELYPADTIPQISPSGRLAQMNLCDDGGSISPIIPGLCPLEEEEGDGRYEYDEMVFPLSGRR